MKRLALPMAALIGGCTTFSSMGPLNDSDAEIVDGRVDASIRSDADIDGGIDGGIDAAVHPVLAAVCAEAVEPGELSLLQAVTTDHLGAVQTECGTAERLGFFQTEIAANARFEVGVWPTVAGQDVSVQILAGCQGECEVEGDRCGAGGAERITYRPFSADTYVVGIASSTADPVRFVASEARCGDGAQQILEGCDDGNVQNGDGCSGTCRRELASNSTVEVEPNDGLESANLLIDNALYRLTSTLTGCEEDRFAIERSGGRVIEVSILTSDGLPCPTDPGLVLELRGGADEWIAGGAPAASSGACPSLTAGPLGAGEHQIVVRGDRNATGSVPYRVRVTPR